MMQTPLFNEIGGLRIYYAYLQPDAVKVGRRGMCGAGQWESLCAHASSLGFNCLLVPPLWFIAAGQRNGVPDDPDAADRQWLDISTMTDALAMAARICMRHKLRLLMDLVLDSAARDGVLMQEHPDWYEDPLAAGRDLRRDSVMGLSVLRDAHGQAPSEFIKAWGERLARWAGVGVAGFRCRAPLRLATGDWGELISQVQARQPACLFMAWTPGLTPVQVQSLADAKFGASFLSLPWWDYRAAWLIEEHDRLRALAPAIALVEDPDHASPAKGSLWTQGAPQVSRRLWAAAFTGSGLLMPMGLEECVCAEVIIRVNQWLAEKCAGDGRLALLSGPLSDLTILFRHGTSPRVLLINADDQAQAPVQWQDICLRLPASYVMDDMIEPVVPVVLQAAQSHMIDVVAASPIITGTSSSAQRASLTHALRAARIAIENVSPAVDDGDFPVKRTLGERVRVQADVFIDGHDCIDVDLLWRAADKTAWHRVPMRAAGNDHWEAQFTPVRLGRYYYSVHAWRDDWRTFCDALRKNVAAGRDVSLEVEEGRILLLAALRRARRSAATALAPKAPAVQVSVTSAMANEASPAELILAALDELGRPQKSSMRHRPRGVIADAGPGRADSSKENTIVPAGDSHVQALLSASLAYAMKQADSHSFHTGDNKKYPLSVERRQARFANWYELFPRSQGSSAEVHGTFLDVIKRLPAIRDMGFDVLYFPPVHPIGLRNRKGRNNSLQAGPSDPGSPYAIGSAEGGHDAVHPQLGSLEDFRCLLDAARDQGLEIALDFAVQCSPDHPWLSGHPEWFDWRADGSLRYAENPPKRYEDIVTPSFYGNSSGAVRQAALWRALRDVVLFWISQGVKTFRVDNPHTKPLPFWQWLIEQVQCRHPDTLFLSEAFTRPRLMYRLAKLGFSQSYTYFTWRNGKQEIIDYLSELDSVPVSDFFRPHFFVNTPDINPYYLQGSGRAGFLVRAALAATTSGLWGMYNGFELCEAQSLPGKEEYQDSEKYELRHWDWERPGNIVAEIKRLNQIRSTNPALQSHRGIRFHSVDNGQILFFSKSTEQKDNVIMVAINLDPHAVQAGTLELPLWQWNLPDDATVHIRDLFNGESFDLHGKYHHIELTAAHPFLIWSRIGPG